MGPVRAEEQLKANFERVTEKFLALVGTAITTIPANLTFPTPTIAVRPLFPLNIER